jgi:hypothetical protein
MPVIPEFQPAQAPGAAVRMGLDAFQQGRSMMERKQRLSMDQETHDAQMQQFDIVRPVLEANAKTNVLKAKVALDSIVQTEDANQVSLAMLPFARQEFNDLIAIKDPDLRGDLARQWIGNYSQLSGVSEIAKEWDQKLHLATQMNVDNLKLRALEAANERAKIAVDGRTNVAEVNAGARTAVARTAADAKRDTASAYTQSRERIADINADTKLSVEDKRGKIAAEKAGATIADLQARASDADQAAADASASGDEHAAEVHRKIAASYRDAVQKTTTFAGSSPSAPAEKSAAPTPPSAMRAPGAKLYVVEPGSSIPTFAPNVKTPKDVLTAIQQMVDDGVTDAETARATLTRLGFKPKK